MGVTGDHYKWYQPVESGLDCHKLCKLHPRCMTSIYITEQNSWVEGHKTCYLKWGTTIQYNDGTGIVSSLRDCSLPCPSDWTPMGTQCYFVGNEFAESFKDALAYCTEKGGMLAEPTNSLKQVCSLLSSLCIVPYSKL